ncbi:retrotransposon protein, putative, ty1-copia subclass [Tanacetum coccineum]|uniref:Retrotransposon protein, putative, ty1-copia subclass n=1 Tax=Tanacetum coccineum TaxID=301880 RepID=A0ABQ5G4G9_9ASTR
MVLGIALMAIIDRQLPFKYTITSRSTDVVVLSLEVEKVLRVEKKMFVIEQPIPPAPAADSAANVLADWNAIYDAYNEGKPVAAYVIQMKGYVDQLERLGYVLSQDVVAGLILNGLTKIFSGFKSNKKSLKAKGKGKANGKGKDKQVYIPKPKNPKPSAKEHPAKDDICHHYKKVGHCKRNCPAYLAKLIKKKKQVGIASSSDVFIIELFSFPTKSWVYDTSCDNCHYASSITRSLVSVHRLVENGFVQCFTDFGILVSKNNVFYFNAIPSNGIYEIDMHDLVPDNNSLYNVRTKRAKHNLDSTYLWHCRLAHISKKRIEKLQQEGLLKSTDDESFDQCVSCLSGKMTRKSFPHRPGRATDLLGIIHTDMCGPLRHVSRQGASYFITFTDDYSRYGYVYLLKHKHESATRIFNMVPTKKVDKTPYELWYGKVPNLSYLKLWGCEALVKRDTPDKLQQRSVKCIFIGYPKETMGYYFYFPPENKIVVARYVEFFEKNLITQEVSGRAMDLEEIQDEDTSPSEITSEIPMEVKSFEPPQEEVIPLRRSERIHRPPDRLCLNVEVEEHSLGDLNEPTSYKAVMLNSESNKWIDAMNAEIQSMMDNMVWVLVDLAPGCKTIGNKWIFKKKTNMDGIVHTYKARLVVKGYTQLYGVDYKETFSPVAGIRAIRILISISVFYDYEIWQIDVKTTMVILMKTFIWYNLKVLLIIIILEKYASFKEPFMVLSKHQEARIKDLMKKSKDLREATFIIRIKIYRDRSQRLIGLGQTAYMDKILKRYKMDNSKRGHIPMQKRLDLNKTLGASTPKEVKRMQNVPYASDVGSIIYAVRCTRPDVAFAQNITSRFQQNPGELHWTDVKNILKYLRNTKDMFLVYGGNPEAELRVDCYCDTGFETYIDDMKSQT